MSSKTQQMPFLPVDGPQEVARDMTDENITRKFRTPVQTSYFITVSLAVCLLLALGTIMVLVFQRMGSCPQCEGHRNQQKEAEAATRHPPNMSSMKAAAYLQVLKPINQSQLRWIKDGILHNIEYNDGNLVIQQPGLYFIYCHLHFFINNCPDKTSDLKLEILVNETSKKQTLLTLCSCEKTSNGTYHNLFQVLLMELKKGYRIAVKVTPFKYVDTVVLSSNNVLGVFLYDREDWRHPLFNTVVWNGR
ncbi:tumor necrosis factor ligand superfamily member 8 [Eublepharis macularius]|uniref:Tumor necrosis factor ligand superfamily member 8 n=1 Tax=Eublepharis macularius TaxID=481883 RepID=A0AA97KF65_EUBMA|nr:tumor necrosis factor ligand superfamily member 8 [Eublepharis macularius]